MARYALFVLLLIATASSQNNFVITEQHQYAANDFASIGIASFSLEEQQIEACRQEFFNNLLKFFTSDKRKFNVKKMDLSKNKLTKQETLELGKGTTLKADLPEEGNLGTEEFAPDLIFIITEFSREEATKDSKEQMLFSASYVIWENSHGHIVAYGTTSAGLVKSKGGYNPKKVTKALSTLAKTVFENMAFIKNK